MPGKRPVGPDDVARGQRFADLRATRWPSQAAMARETGIDRLRIMRLESGEERFTSAAFQEEIAAAFDLPPSALIDYARGRLELEALLAGGRETPAPPTPRQAAPPQRPTTDPYPNRVAFLALHGDQISPQTRAFIQSVSFSSGDKEIAEWRAMAKEAEHERSAFVAALTRAAEKPPTNGDPGGWGTLPPRKTPKRR